MQEWQQRLLLCLWEVMCHQEEHLYMHTLMKRRLMHKNDMMLGLKAPNYDTYELFRATHSHNSPQYSHIVGLSSHFYAHIGAGPKVFHPPMSKLMWA